MNKTESVSIGRRGFICEQDAYRILQDYLERSERALQYDPDRDEILADLEVSMAGHLLEQSFELVVDKATAQKVIDMMGEVESGSGDEAEDGGSEQSSARADEPFATKLKKIFKQPLYKDHDHQIGDGVCAGIAKSLDIDAIWVRIVFILLAFVTQGFMILVYFVLDIIMKDEEGYHKRTAGEIVQGVREKIADSVSANSYESRLRRIVVGFFTVIWWIFKIVAILAITSVVVSIGVAWGYLLFATFVHAQLASDVLGDVTWLKTLAIGLAGVVLLLPLAHILALLISPKKVLANTRLGVMIWVTWFIALFAGVGAVGNTLPEVLTRWKENPPHTRYINVRVADGNIKDVCADLMGGCLESKRYIIGGGANPCSTNYNQFYKGEADYWIGKLYTTKGYIRIAYPGTREDFCEQAVPLIKKYEGHIAFSDDFENEDVITVTENLNGQPVQKKYWQVEYIYNESASAPVSK